MTLADIDEARPVLITGGAGFIGCNVASRLLAQGRRVIIFDNLSRGSVERNLSFLKGRYGSRLEVVVGDVRQPEAVAAAVHRASAVFHFAAQVAVTSSLVDPVTDFDVNARGTMNVLEALRSMRTPAPLLFTSTNKVYGALEDVALVDRGRRCVPEASQVADAGISEARPLDFHSPYGCSKGAADQYVRDYARSFGLPTVVFRMSCIYGPRQFGNEDQGWLAHFLISAAKGLPITIYGDGRQVRDVLFVEDLIDAMLVAQSRIGELSGAAFNIGGGPQNTMSLLELLESVERLVGRLPPIEFAETRVGDQRYYVSDTRAFENATGWKPRFNVSAGLDRLGQWVRELCAEPQSAAVFGGALH